MCFSVLLLIRLVTGPTLGKTSCMLQHLAQDLFQVLCLVLASCDAPPGAGGGEETRKALPCDLISHMCYSFSGCNSRF